MIIGFNTSLTELWLCDLISMGHGYLSPGRPSQALMKRGAFGLICPHHSCSVLVTVLGPHLHRTSCFIAPCVVCNVETVVGCTPTGLQVLWSMITPNPSNSILPTHRQNPTRYSLLPLLSQTHLLDTSWQLVYTKGWNWWSCLVFLSWAQLVYSAPPRLVGW